MKCDANILEKADETALAKKVMKKEKWVSQQTEALDKKRVTLRNKNRNHRNRENYDNWREAAKLTDESFQMISSNFLKINVCKQKKQLTLGMLP